MLKKTHKIKLTALFLSAALLSLAACGNAAQGNANPGNTDSDHATLETIKPEAAPTSPVTPVGRVSTDLTAEITPNTVPVAQRNNPSATVAATDFGVRLFQQNMLPGDNILLSPASVLFALGMTANGAKANTLAQFESVFGIPVEELNAYLYAYRQSLPNEENCKVTAANSIWFRDEDGLSVAPEFLQKNTDYYAATVSKAPFDDTTRDDINNWVKENTSGMIDRILDNISKDDSMYLINAMAFEAKWAEPYETYDVREAGFTREDGTVLQRDFMYSEEQKYLEDEAATGFLKYYEGGKYAFAALLPNEGVTLGDYVASLNGERLNGVLNSPADIKVYASIPKYEAEYLTELGKPLSAMGLSDAFDENLADFTGLATSVRGNIFIDRILHKTYICIDEQGTKAAAVTAVAVADCCAFIEEPQYKVVYLDRPFVYFLIDCEEGLPIFMGAVYTP